MGLVRLAPGFQPEGFKNKCERFDYQFPIPNSQCPMPNAQCPITYYQFPIPKKKVTLSFRVTSNKTV
ncbi:hypothetical protein [Tolypothrix sp. VBCCA 56010]|uniref:hypothetical protein n=1 Tax=Tolypothrix sp. VBCCA 56010 TaxID=3137731 RepID=UPI003D7D690E